MDLYAGTPYWMVKNPLWSYCNPLREDIRTEAVVIGAGITGALVAHRLQRAGIDCCVVDKRTPGTGSSCASTALLQYEIDVPLCRMARMMPEQDAATAYRSCLRSDRRTGATLPPDEGRRRLPTRAQHLLRQRPQRIAAAARRVRHPKRNTDCPRSCSNAKRCALRRASMRPER